MDRPCTPRAARTAQSLSSRLAEALGARSGLRHRAVAALGIIGLTAGGLVMLTPAPAGATTVNDEVSFRAAWTNTAETVIDLAADITLTCPGGAPTRTGTTALTLDGHGHTLTQTCATGAVLVQNGTGAITVQNLTVTGGHATLNGGGINANAAALTVTNSTITGNTAGLAGGGLRTNNATLRVTNSTISNNTAAGGGGMGGGLATGGGALTVTNSTISGNTASGAGVTGGGIGTASGAVTVTNSTVSGNTASGANATGGGIGAIGGSVTVTGSTLTGNTAALDGGGIRDNTAAVSVASSTISGNTAGGAGGGIRDGSGAVNLVYATVVDNSGTAGANVRAAATLTSFGSVIALHQGGSPNCASLTVTTSNGFNYSDDASCGFTAATDKQNGSDPGLAALADNGGPTQTRLPQVGSPLRNAIPNGSCHADGAAAVTTDQRGFPRPPQGAACDIGALEVETAVPPAAVGAQTIVVTPRFTG